MAQKWWGFSRRYYNWRDPIELSQARFYTRSKTKKWETLYIQIGLAGGANIQ